MAAQIDHEGKYISIELTNRLALERMLPWVKGMRIDQQSGVIITWSQGNTGSQAYVAFNRLNNRVYEED